MRQKHNMLLAGVAALALIAGGGIAAAQQSPQGQTKAGVSAQGAAQAQTPSGKQGGAAGGMEQHAQTSSPAAKTGQSSMAQKSAEGAKPENAKPENRSAQIGQKNAQDAKQSAQSGRQQLGENAKSTNAKSTNEAKQRVGENGKESIKPESAKTESAKSGRKSRERVGAMEKNRHERIGANSRLERGHKRMGANTRSERGHSRISERSKRQGEIKGLQGNASIPMQGSHVNLTSRQRNRIRNTVIDARGAPRVGHVGFDVTVGTLVPRDRVHVIRVPETLVRIDPQWHGYLYFVVEDQVVIVNPRDMRIVAVLDV